MPIASSSTTVVELATDYCFAIKGSHGDINFTVGNYTIGWQLSVLMIDRF
jgi:hypothetical protein